MESRYIETDFFTLAQLALTMRAVSEDTGREMQIYPQKKYTFFSTASQTYFPVDQSQLNHKKELTSLCKT